MPPLLVTMGEPAGIGGELALKAWAARRDGIPPFVLLDDIERLHALAGRIGLKVPFAAIEDPGEAAAVWAEALPVLHQPLTASVEPGRPDPANGQAVIRSIERAVSLVMSGAAGAVVTNPISKAVLHRAGFAHPGHTEFLGELAGAGAKPVMMLAGPSLRVVPVTVSRGARPAR